MTFKSVPRPLESGPCEPLPNGRGTVNVSLKAAQGICPSLNSSLTRSQDTMHNAASQNLADDLIRRLDDLINEAERKTKPLEVDPYRSQLFELFVVADASGLMQEGSTPDLSPDGVSRLLAQHWGLAAAAASSHLAQSKLSPEHLSKMRLLWSFLRMWMEWQYAWSRFPEFRDGAAKPELASSEISQ